MINADDFYGRNGFEVLARFLAGTDGTGQYCMVGYRVGNTLSESGSVSRGVCETDTDGFLTSVTECTEIRRQEGRGIIFRDEQDEYHALAPETPVSMNMWGFTPDYMDFSARLFARFLAERGHELKSEFYIPTVVNEAIRCGAAKVKGTRYRRKLVRCHLCGRPAGCSGEDTRPGGCGRIPRTTLVRVLRRSLSDRAYRHRKKESSPPLLCVQQAADSVRNRRLPPYTDDTIKGLP